VESLSGQPEEAKFSPDIWRDLDGIPLDDWNVFLHELRGRRIATMPAGARTVLSAGCAGAWYFEWFDERYPTSVDRHIGVELFSPRPANLPGNMEWISSSLDDLSSVESGVVDLVFAGQLIEHLWPESSPRSYSRLTGCSDPMGTSLPTVRAVR
jgi:hypothetical protein